MKPESEIRARLTAAHAAYSVLLAEAERDEENQTPAEHEDYRYRLHLLNRERETLEWVLDLNKHGQPTGEHLVREAKDLLNPPLK
jgi:hypothetical protein